MPEVEITSWSQLTIDQLVWRREDLQNHVDEHPEKEWNGIKLWIAEIDAELESRRQTA